MVSWKVSFALNFRHSESNIRFASQNVSFPAKSRNFGQTLRRSALDLGCVKTQEDTTWTRGAGELFESRTD